MKSAHSGQRSAVTPRGALKKKRRIYGDDLRTQANRAGIGFARFGQFWATERFSGSAHVRKSRVAALLSRREALDL
jgi:hypothetical protein